MSFDRGQLLIAEASLGFRIIELINKIPEIKKVSKKTPHASKLQEIANVQKAKDMLPKLIIDLDFCLAERAGLRELLFKMNAWGKHGKPLSQIIWDDNNKKILDDILGRK